MAHFAQKDDLKTFVDATEVEAMFTKIPQNYQEQHFSYADKIVTAKTGESPTENNNHPVLASIAARIALWFLSGNKQWNESNRPELDRREKLYNAALDELEAVASGEISLNENEEVEEVKSATGSSAARVSRW